VNSHLINEWRLDKDSEGDGCGLLQLTAVMALAWKNRGNPRKFIFRVAGNQAEWKWLSLEYKSRIFPLHHQHPASWRGCHEQNCDFIPPQKRPSVQNFVTWPTV